MEKRFWEEWRPGILSGKQIRTICKKGIISGHQEGKIKHASLDLCLSSVGWQTTGSFKLLKGELLEEVLKRNAFIVRRLKLDNGTFFLKENQTYIFKLVESISPSDENLRLCGVATGKSSIGRLDVLTRLIADGWPVFDWVPESTDWTADQEKLNLYLEVTPMSFPIRVRPGDSLNQLRFFRGKPELSLLRKQELDEFFPMDSLISDSSGDKRDLSLDLTCVRIGKNTTARAFRAKQQGNKEIEISLGKDSYEAHDFWEIDSKESDSLKIEKDLFYILRSKERFRLPSNIGVYCEAVTENLGEIRIHYAGFVHPEFGKDRKDKLGAPLIFEVRGHSVEAYLRQGEIMARLKYYWMSEPANDKKHSYSNQELTLSRSFKKWVD